LVGDAEELDLETELGGERFDAILFADVLEHLRDPAALLKRVRPLVAENGVVIASIPNVAHASVRLALLGGSFRYREWGLLDETHLRFFTRHGVEDLRPLRSLGGLRQAHEVLQRRLIAERAAFAQGIAAVEEGVYGSRSWRYTAPIRRALKLFRRDP